VSDLPLVNALRRSSGLQAKSDIRSAAATFCHQPFPQLGLAGMLGDDTAVVPAQIGQLLLACEGMYPDLVEEDPWFAGWSGVLVNLSDIAAGSGEQCLEHRRGRYECLDGGNAIRVRSLWCANGGWPLQPAELLPGALCFRSRSSRWSRSVRSRSTSRR
jgi:hypothetical protein